MTAKLLPRSLAMALTMVTITSLACAMASPSTPEPAAPAATGPMLYVANQDAATVSIIDTE